MMRIPVVVLIASSMLLGCATPLAPPNPRAPKPEECVATGGQVVVTVVSQQVVVDPPCVRAEASMFGIVNNVRWRIDTNGYTFLDDDAVKLFSDEKVTPITRPFPGCGKVDDARYKCAYIGAPRGSIYWYTVTVRQSDGKLLISDPTVLND